MTAAPSPMTPRNPAAISTDAVAALVRENRLDGAAAAELLKQADELLKDLVKAMENLERKMQIMLVADLAILYLLFRAGGFPAPEFAATLQLPMEWAARLWSALLLGAWTSAVFAMFCLARGLLAATEFGLRGDWPNNWDINILTLSPDNDGSNRDFILGHLCVKYAEKIAVTQSAYDRKLRLYKRGFLAHGALLTLLALGALLRLLAGMPL